MTQRQDLKKLVKRHLRDAHILFSEKQYASAYYIAGYAVECGIKVCIAEQFRKNTIPDKKIVNDTYTHDFERLLRAAGIYDDLMQDIKNNNNLFANWHVVKDWRTEVRYSLSLPRLNARDLINAIEDQNDGVLHWLRLRW